MLLYRLYTGPLKEVLLGFLAVARPYEAQVRPAGHPRGAFGSPSLMGGQEDTRRWAHTFATLVAYLKSGISAPIWLTNVGEHRRGVNRAEARRKLGARPETMEHGFVASFINVFAHNFDELWSESQSALPKPPASELGRSQSRELLNERFLTELRSWVLERKERLVWPTGGDEAGAKVIGCLGFSKEDEEKEDDEEEEGDEEEEEEEEEEAGKVSQRAMSNSQEKEDEEGLLGLI